MLQSFLKIRYKKDNKCLPTSYSDANGQMSPIRQRVEALNSLQGDKDCGQILAFGCSAWHRPGGMSSLLKAWPSLPTSVPPHIYHLEPLVLLLWLQ